MATKTKHPLAERLERAAFSLAKDRSVPQEWRDANPPEITWDELHEYSKLLGEAARAIRATRGRHGD